MCGLYYPHPSNTIFISKEIKDDAERENAYEENEDKLQVKKNQPTYLRISTRYDPCMPRMTSKKWDVVALHFKITTVLKLSPTLLTQKVPWPSVFLTSKISPLQSAFLFLLFSFILIPLSAFEPPRFLPLQHWNPLHQHGKHTPHYFSCTYEASSLPSVFSLLHH